VASMLQEASSELAVSMEGGRHASSSNTTVTHTHNNYSSAPDRGEEYCDERVCVCVFVCPWSYLRNYPSDLQIFVHVTYGSVLLWRRSDTLCTSGFVVIVYDIIFAYKPRLLDVAAQLKRSAHAAFAWL